MEQPERDKILERLAFSVDKAYNQPGMLMWRGFLIGLASGIGGTIGIALVITLLTILVANLGGIPIIGEALKDLLNVVNPDNSQSLLNFIKQFV